MSNSPFLLALGMAGPKSARAKTLFIAVKCFLYRRFRSINGGFQSSPTVGHASPLLLVLSFGGMAGPKSPPPSPPPPVGSSLPVRGVKGPVPAARLRQALLDPPAQDPG
ncbi:proline-rich protein 12-like [Engraulis encrasicolus]|uniref:proline-rich protein 12-like n=1 Tax=Engraulis encrasicolus TaxID=184585 RepID=UPI002FCEB7FF